MATASSFRFGSDVPFAEPPELQGHFSPYYGERHHRWRALCRDFVERELLPHVDEWDEAGDVPVEELRSRAYAAGLYGATWPRELGGTPPEGSEGDWKGSWEAIRVDPFFDMIMWDELARCSAGGVLASLFVPTNIGLPPVVVYGSDSLRERVARPCIAGTKACCLCVTEPSGGSDVAAIRTTAVREGDFYIVNGSKKWITGGMKADFFTVLCRTGQSGSGSGGSSMLVLERGMPGITTRRMKTQGWWASNTTYIEFDNVRVPVANRIGQEGEGFKYTMVNFNHERFVLTVQAVRFARICLEEAIRFARRRKTFGQRLVDHQVIRHKIAEMARRVDSTHRSLENYAYQVKCGFPERQLGGYMALLKVDGSRLMELCAREASQIFGGQSFTRDGAGGRVERIYREVRVMAIGGGSEEVMINLAMNQAKL
uniref:Acyl-CoA dehydrogenase n=1 Tax=Alexandrium catenella TaxID=2925 RepID=A0A7S1R8E3_ALECA